MGGEVSKISKETQLTEEEVVALRQKFEWLAAENPQDRSAHAVIGKACFVAKFPPTQEALAELIFHAMDPDGTGVIDFPHFCAAVAALSIGESKARAQFAFGLYDRDNNGYFAKNDIIAVIHELHHASAHVLHSIGFQESIPCRSLQEIHEADALLQSMPHGDDGRVSRDQFVAFCEKHPDLLEQLTVVFSSLKHAAGWEWTYEESKGDERSCAMC